jgi:hypothetical protein
MAKNIKKSFKYLIVIAGILIILPTILFTCIRIPAVQTFMVRRITSHISEAISSTISVGRMEYLFFNRLNLNEVLIRDRNNDTMIYIPEATLSIRSIDIKRKSYTLGQVIITNPTVSFITDTSGIMNMSWYLDLLQNPGDTSRKGGSIIKINEAHVSDARFSLIDRRDEPARIPTDFNNLHVYNINGTVEDFVVKDDSTKFNISELSFTESAGLTVKEMSSSVSIARNDIFFKKSSVICDSSILNIRQVRLSGDSVTSFSNFIDDVRMDIRLEKSQVGFSDLKYIVPAFNRMKGNVWFSGKVSGTVSEMRGRNINITYGDYTSIGCDFDLSGLPDFQNSFIYIGINNLRTNAKDIEKIRFPGKKSFTPPLILRKLGNMSFDGSFTGFLSDFVAYGNLRTKDGTISTDISLRPEEKNRYKINGLVRGTDIAIGSLTEKPEMFGNLTMKANIDGYAYTGGKFSGNLTGHIDSIEVNKYEYRDINLKGLFTENTWDGDVSLNDENIKMDILGMFDFSKDLPEFDFTLNLAKADLYKLHFDKTDTSSNLSLLMTANFKGSNIDNLDGYVKLLNSNFRKYNKNLDSYDFSVRTFIENDKPAISLRTDFADADLRGYYNFAELGNVFRKALSAMMPARFPMPETKNDAGENNFSFSVNLKNTDKLNNFFRTGMLIADKSNLNFIIASDSIMKLSATSKAFSYKGFSFTDLALAGDFSSPGFNFSLKSSLLNLLGQSDLKGFNATIQTSPDNFVFRVNWDNKDQILNRGTFTTRGSYIRPQSQYGIPLLSMNIDSTEIYSRNNLWKISPSVITVDTNSINVNKLYISNKQNYYLIDGTISENKSDTLHLEFKGIDISWLNGLVSRNSSADQFTLSLKGTLNGNVLASDLYHNPLLESNLKVSNFSLLQSNLGDMAIVTAWNNEKKVADIKAFNNLAGKKLININGYYDPLNRKLDLTGIADKLPLDALNPLLRFFASGITGTGTGKVRFIAESKNIELKGAVMAENATMKIDYLQTKYRLNDSIRFVKDAIQFRNVRVTDDKGNVATLNGSVDHKNFKNYTTELSVATNESMVLNTKPKDNSLFYGTAFATGVATIKSVPGTLSFDVSAKTGKNTKFYIPLNSSETVSDYSFITFVRHDTATSSSQNKEIKVVSASSSGVELNFDLDVTPEAEVQLIFDPKVGDIMKGHGSGNLNISLNKKGEFKISGDYIIEEGDYLFTLKNIFNKSFSVEDGGKISFNGDINNAEIEMKAVYKLKASLYEILKDEKFKEKIPVECQINLSGKLFNPIVAFNIYLPMADEETRTYLKNVITTEEELSRQFLYLLVMNSFYSDPAYGTSLTSTTTSTGTSAMAVTTTEMLSNQLSNWLSQLSNDFDIGVNYIPGQKNFNDQEVQVALSTQMFNDRVVINGNLDVRGIGGLSDNTDQLTGDFDIETRITDRIKFKVFNRYNNPYTGKQSQYTQGFGIFFRQDFDKFSDLFRKRMKSDIKKEETPKEQKSSK